MAVLERSELEASPLADLHTIANQLGIDGFRRLRKADLVDAILGASGGDVGGGEDAERPPRTRSSRTRGGRSRSKSRTEDDADADGEADADADADADAADD